MRFLFVIFFVFCFSFLVCFSFLFWFFVSFFAYRFVSFIAFLCFCVLFLFCVFGWEFEGGKLIILKIEISWYSMKCEDIWCTTLITILKQLRALGYWTSNINLKNPTHPSNFSTFGSRILHYFPLWTDALWVNT